MKKGTGATPFCVFRSRFHFMCKYLIKPHLNSWPCLPSCPWHDASRLPPSPSPLSLPRVEAFDESFSRPQIVK